MKEKVVLRCAQTEHGGQFVTTDGIQLMQV